MTRFEKEQLIQMKKMELQQIANGSMNIATKKTGFFGSVAGISVASSNLKRVKQLKQELEELKAIEVSD